MVEANEVPPRVFRRFADFKPSSNIARLLESSSLVTTVADDVPRSFLYPSQTWASFNTGAPYDKHKIHWYNDPKPAEYPMYWKILADSGYSVGLVNSLHASPLPELIEHSKIAFLLPDVFTDECLTKPAKYLGFHAFNRDQSDANRRVTSVAVGAREVGIGLRLPFLGVRPATLLNVAKTAFQVATKRVNKERLRNVQFMLLADMFVRLLRQSDVDLGIFFSNHVAGNMHRYWYALFTGDYTGEHYGQAWVEHNSDEIIHAMMLFDSFIGTLMAFCDRTDRTLIINSSMGQHANTDIDTSVTRQYVIKDLDRFLEAVGIQSGIYELQGAMEPQYTLQFQNLSHAQGALEQLERVSTDELKTSPELHGTTLTITLGADPFKDEFELLGTSMAPADIGMEAVPIDDHHSGRHHEEGTLILRHPASSASSPQLEPARIGYLEFAPMMLEYFGVSRPDYMAQPSIKVQ